MNVGNRIRLARKKVGINMKDFASLLGVSYLTLHRVETDKVSPSVALLSEIARHLGEPIVNFLDEEKGLTIVRSGTAPTLQSGKLSLEVLVPKGAVSEQISVTLGRAEPGEFVSKHAHSGFELTYHLKGRVLFKYGDKEYQVDQGDMLCFDSSIEHSVVALEKHEFISVYFRKFSR